LNFVREPLAEQGTQLVELGLAAQRGADRSHRVVLLRERGVPERDDRIPLVFVDRAPLLLDDVGHGGEVVIEQLREVLRAQHLGNRREALQIGEEDGDVALLPAELEPLGMGDELLDDRRAEILLEGALDVAFLLAFRGVAREA